MPDQMPPITDYRLSITCYHTHTHTPTPTRTRAHTRGFTLIEILVVLVIIAILTAVAVLAFGQFGRGRREQMIADQFSRVIRVAEQQAILTSTVLGLGISSNGYQFYQYQLPVDHRAGYWQPLQSTLSNPTAFHRVFDVRVLSIAHFDAVSKKEGVPRILLLPSGFVTAFSVQLTGSRTRFLITVAGNGATQVSK